MQSIMRPAARVLGRRTVITAVQDADHFQKLISESPKAVVQFTAGWCGPCKVIAPHFSKLSDANEGIAFLKVDVDECPDVAGDFNVTSIPHFVALSGETQTDTLFGANAQGLDKLVSTLKSA
eukprot:TRINITY_DN3222_c3_g1_i1.p2 TRINITY_DN3222_c3_g1~~TRINITY_DN3222_c3_g1_i1.p2  ORF type:complete len:122 (+),score=20.39 TRINITY_DN3222_c3_g1_i1:68-433(+)